jgi:high-affinity nickel-transport protein
LVAANLAAWVWAFAAFHQYPVLLGTALLAYGFGLRHAVDADHIAAIDNVTRSLMAAGQRPLGVGLFFSLGHSTVVVAASVGIALAADAMARHMAAAQAWGGVAGTLISAGFLLTIGAANAVILVEIWRVFRRVRRGEAVEPVRLDAMLAGGGLVSRLIRPVFGAIRRSWHMYPLGVLFGLGFDTATEVGVLGISAVQAAHGLPIWSILVFPALFTAGMSLVDTLDGILMLRAYGWAFVKPLRKLFYNMTMTLVSVLAALVVGGVEALGLIGDQLGLHGMVWNFVAALNTHFGMIGYLIIGVFVAVWAAAAAVYRGMGLEPVEGR